jgi:hypothetical protein
MSFVKIIHSVPDSAETMQHVLDIDDSVTSYSEEAVSALFPAIVDGNQISYTKVSTGSIQAYGLITTAGTASNGETALVANVTLTAKTSGADPTAGEFDISGTVATQAANIALAINSVAALVGIVTATSALGVVTITAVVPGVMGNGLQLSEGLGNTTATAFAHGDDGKQVAVNYGAAS